MPRKKHTADEIIRKLRQAEVWLGEGKAAELASVLDLGAPTERHFAAYLSQASTVSLLSVTA